MENTKRIKDGLKFLSIYILLIILLILVPFMGTLTLILLPIPFILYTNKHGLKPGIVLGLLSFFLLFIITPLALPFTISFVAGGIVIGELYRRKKEAFAVLLGGSLAFIAALILNYLGSILILQVNPVEVIQELLNESVELSEQMLSFVGQTDENVLESATLFINELPYIAPVIMIILGIGFAFIVQWIASLFMRRWDYEVSLFLPFREWTFPRVFIWYYLIAYILLLIGAEKGTAMYTVIANLTPLLDFVMIIQGFSFIFYYFHMKGKSKVLPILILIISFVLPFLIYLVRILGIIDIGFELRKRMNSTK
ncbi:YybS family protein [Evansella sp. AB-rgal1]|uniref:YybS family protein n=1 Tax=Evansella sp. AB-rgal1 TaxID=3242696 RepID=UPI00359CED9F